MSRLLPCPSNSTFRQAACRHRPPLELWAYRCQFIMHLPQGKLAQLCASEWDKWAVVDIRYKKMSWLLGKKLFSVRGPGGSWHLAHIFGCELALQHAFAADRNCYSSCASGLPGPWDFPCWCVQGQPGTTAHGV